MQSSMLTSPLLFLLLIHCLSMSSLRYKALCIDIKFLVLWPICLNSSLVYFKNGSAYLTRMTAQVFISLMRFLLLSLVSRSFLILLRYSFLIFSFILLYGYTTWMLTKHMEKKAWQQLHKNAASNTEQVPEAAPHKAAAVWLLNTHHENYSS